MYVLLTGASSFTGFWFARMLVAQGATVLATLSGPEMSEAYTGVRAQRVLKLKELCRTEFGAPFGGAAFFDLVRRESHVDIFCHHWSQVRDYKSPAFDVLAAVAENTRGFTDLLHLLKDKGCGRIVLTGSVGEPDEGAGSRPAVAFNPYTLSKRLSYEFARYYCERERVVLDKFVIPNPFGPFEEPRFTHYLMTSWIAARVPVVMTPAYVRDNIHVDLLASAYARFVLDHTRNSARTGSFRLGPSGYVETQRAFAEHLAREVGPRLGIACPVRHTTQHDFPEPPVRINTDVPDSLALGWNESAAWDNFVMHYQKRLSSAWC